MTHPYGVPENHPNADLLQALMAERYGPIRDLEHERVTTVPPRPRRPAHQPVSAEAGDLNLLALTVDLDRRDLWRRGSRVAAPPPGRR
ncbi:MAG: hypothetical protein ACRDQA_07570 [Nocardioidaceae bacterium]